MDEELRDLTTEETLEVDVNEIIESRIESEDLEHSVKAEETINFIEIEPIEEVVIGIEESVGWVGGDSTKHYSLFGREEPDQHTIGSISGLRAELDNIEKLQTVFSDKKGQADYYLWDDGNSQQENRVGRFVSLCGDKITICKGNNIFGVTVDDAGFIGGQAEVCRDVSYGLVARNGAVAVRYESGIQEGDYVIPDDDGRAKKADNNYGYKVIAIQNINGMEYAIINLQVEINKIRDLINDVDALDERVGEAEINIVASINLANSAYNKANEAASISDEAIQKALESLEKSDNAIRDTENMSGLVSDANKVANEAKAIIDGIENSVKDMHDKAVTNAGQALDKVSQLEKEFGTLSTNINSGLGEANIRLTEIQGSIDVKVGELQNQINTSVATFDELKVNLKPLSEWHNADGSSGIAGFVEQVNDNGAILGSLVEWKNGDGDESLAGFVSKATEDNATVKALAEYKYTDKQGNKHASVAALDAYAKDNAAGIEAIVGTGGSIAGLQAQINDNVASVTTLASNIIGDYVSIEAWDEIDKDTGKVYYAEDTKFYWYYDDEWTSTDKSYKAELTGTLAGVQQIADENKAQLATVASYNKNGNTGLAGLAAYVDENSAGINTLASYKNEDSDQEGIAGLVADVNTNTSTLSLVASYSGTNEKGETYNGLSGLMAQVDGTKSDVSIISDRITGDYIVLKEAWNPEGKNTDKVYYVKAQDKDSTDLWYYYHNNEWKDSEDPYEAGLPRSIAGIQTQADENSASITSLTSWQGATINTIASIEQKADDNGASIKSIVSSVDKYSVGEYSQAYGLTREQASNILKSGYIYIPTAHQGTPSHSETFVGETTPNDFTPGNYYVWGINGQGEADWIEYGVGGVVFGQTCPTPSSGIPKYWYIDSDTAPDGYEPYTLYMWAEDKWVKVNIFCNNPSNRMVSSISQEIDNISLEIVNARGSYAGLNARLTNTESQIQTTTQWVKGTTKDGDKLCNLATIEQKSDDDGSSLALVVADTEGNKILNGASIVLGQDGEESFISFDADHINFDVEGFQIDAQYINLNGAVTANEYFKINTDGSMIATGGDIGGWKIDDSSLSKKIKYKVTNGSSSTTYTSNVIIQPSSSSDNKVFSIGQATGDYTSSDPSKWDYPFYVRNDGYLYATNAKIEGEINATSGKIGKCEIGTDGHLKIGNTNISDGSISTSKIDGIQKLIADEISGTTITAEVANIAGWTVNDYGIWSDGALTIRNYKYTGSINISTQCFYNSYCCEGGTGGYWLLTIGDNFGVEQDGEMFCSKGQIGGWKIGSANINWEDENNIEDSIFLGHTLVWIEKGSSGTTPTNGQTNWKNIVGAGYAYGQGSDRDIKNSIETFPDQYDDFFDKLMPCRFKYNDYGDINTYHTGFVAQDVLQALNDSGMSKFDLAAYEEVFEPKANSAKYRLQKDEFVALNTWQIQKAKIRITELEAQVASLTDRLEALEKGE